MKFHNKTTFFHVWEEKLWGDRVDANNYFSSLTAWVTMIVSAIPICVGFFSTMGFESDLLLRGVEAGFVSVLVFGAFNIGESIIACQEVSIIIKRSLLLLLVLICASVLGVLLSLVIIAIVCIVLGIIVLYFVIGILNQSLSMPSLGSSKRTEDDADMEQTDRGRVKKDWESMDGLEMKDTHGHHYSRRSSLENFKRDDY